MASDRSGNMDAIMALPRCYIASPFGFTEAGRYYYEQVYLPALSTVVEPVDPWSLTSTDEILAAQASGEMRAMSLEIGRRNMEAIRSSEMLVACLDGQEPDSGTVGELGFAAGVGLPCFAVRSDLREAGEAGVVVNLQVETFVVSAGGAIFPTLDALVAGVNAFIATAFAAAR